MAKQRKFMKLVKDDEGFHGPKGKYVGPEGELSDEGLLDLIDKNMAPTGIKERNMKKYLLTQLRQRFVDLRNEIDELKEDQRTIGDLSPIRKRVS